MIDCRWAASMVFLTQFFNNHPKLMSVSLFEGSKGERPTWCARGAQI